MLLGEALDELADVGPLLGQVFSRAGHDRRGQAVLRGDLERAALAGHAHEDAVGGREAGLVEVHRGVEAGGPRVAVVLEDAVVGGEHGEAAALDEPVEEAHRDGASLLGIGAGAELVEKDEAVRRGGRHDAADRADMAGEGRERLVDRLLVADVGEDGVEDREARLGGRGEAEAELVHQGEEADGLEGDGLAAGVGARDDERPRALRAARRRWGLPWGR